MITRRQLFSNSIKTGLSAAALAAFPASIQRALAIPANNKTGTIQDVEHVVILMQENRSFDHYFGTLKGVRGFSDRITIPLPGGRQVWEQKRANGQVLTPYHFDSRKHNAQRASGTPHYWEDSQRAWDNGRMTSWPVDKEDKSMGYLKEQEVPFHFALANAFTICDAYHCSMHTGTDANRSFHLTGTNGATATKTAFVSNEWDAIDGLPHTTGRGYTWKTYAERLEDAGVSWISYQNMPDEWGDNMLGAFRTFKKANIDSGFPVSSGGAPNSPYTQTGQSLPYHAYDHATDNAKNPLYKGIANTLPGNKPEEYLDAFRRDVKEGRLPQVSWINAPSIYCEHPGPSSPIQGSWFIQEILDALTAVPEVWSKTVFLINYDENDGYFDHVPSPSAPSKQGNSYAGKSTLSEEQMNYEYHTYPKPEGSAWQHAPKGEVFGPGPRVPMLVISPWSRGGWVNSQVFDHTSVLRFLEQRFGIEETNISPFRRAVCGDLTSALNFKNPNDDVLPELNGKITRAEADETRRAQQALSQTPVPADNAYPIQQRGIKQSRALPYELHTSARCLTQDGVVKLLFSNTGTQGAVFHVYNKLDLAAIPRRYVVEAGKTIDDVWPVAQEYQGQYDLWVMGPNGYHRHFKGDLNRIHALEQNPEIRVCYDISNGHVSVDLVNTGAKAVEFVIKPVVYRLDAPIKVTVAAGATHTQKWDLTESYHWYDFEVRSSQDTSYYRRFAGRVETGQDSVTDPAQA
ncbi:phosphocholine-specific phospholipase C [Acinetobacter rudis]|uniref:Phospholipase C, phosphocholine-specific n=1 Tax=Acinetobacter rudis CIP 110305 TaxID=421052 RepID=S3MV29_9GAMM|nr:phospholipase C, phosphocholine-specific [Acinetobacter rudis]EPF71387.1 phospholipase C, phosphocholine-specific [Acinetobacter rudis CIP 110305]